MSTVFGDAREWQRRQVEEYSQYVAAYEIRNATGVVVYGAGYPIPADNVESDGSVILLRHACPGKDPVTGELCTIPHNEVLERTDKDAAKRVATKSEAKKEAGK